MIQYMITLMITRSHVMYHVQHGTRARVQSTHGLRIVCCAIIRPNGYLNAVTIVRFSLATVPLPHHARGSVFRSYICTRICLIEMKATPPNHPLFVCLPSRLEMSHYVLKKTIKRHYDSINTLAFSHDGSLFASGSDDGLIIVFQGNGSGREIR